METITLRDVQHLPSEVKRSLETLLRHPVEDGQGVIIMTFRPGVVPDEATRRHAHATLIRTLEEAADHAHDLGVTPEEADDAVDRAMGEIRPRPA